jgi:hypothetical protein
VGKLRTALGDSADNPSFIETVPRRLLPLRQSWCPHRPRPPGPNPAAGSCCRPRSSSSAGFCLDWEPGSGGARLHRNRWTFSV